ncbi:acyltransferase [Mycobacterium sp.]|uniref:acyltransferase family protein n=1 Tax=Mycobacterium sp. TaxID=1785 RepID=UPI0025D1A6B6|nr:acyltransferase [Mycobacterium sp.]
MGLALLSTGALSGSWWLVVAAPVALYCIYWLGVRRFFPARPAGSVPQRTSVMPRGSRRYTDWLLLIRGLACGLVFVMHSGIAFGHDASFGHSRWAWILLSPAWLGMILFFTLSGYLMGKGFYTGKYDLSQPGVALYLRNRFLRIFPLMFVVALLIAALNSPKLLAMPQVAVRLSLFEYNGSLGTAAIAAFWSLSTEWQYYLLVPAAFAIALAVSHRFVSTRKVLLPVATLFVLGVGVLIREYMWTHHGAVGWAYYMLTPLISNIDVFLLGFLTNWWVPRLARLARVTAAWPLLLVGIYLAYSFISYQAMISGSQTWFPTFAVILPGAIALALIPVLAGCELWNRKARMQKVPQRKTAFVLFWVGELTYPIYLVHSAILISVQEGMPRQTYAEKWAIATILVILIAWILHMTVEEAVLNWRRRMHRAAKPEGCMEPEARLLDSTRLGGQRVSALMGPGERDQVDSGDNGDLDRFIGEPVTNSVNSEVV